MSKGKKCLRIKFIAFTIVLALLASIISFANAAEPPSILIIVKDAPEDLVLSIVGESGWTDAIKTSYPLEEQFRFYNRDLAKKQPYRIRVQSRQYNYLIETQGLIRHYNNVFTLDLKTGDLSEGKTFYRTLNLVGMRVGLTLVIEGFIFYIMGYRQRKSWLIFLSVNLITQLGLNLWLNDYPPSASYLILTLIYGELFVYLAELIFIVPLVYEKRMKWNMLYVLTANTLSLVLGGWLIVHLSV